jgi:iron complex outermembrane receptor protein
LDAAVIKTFASKSKIFGRIGSTYRYPFIDEQISYFGFGGDAFYTDLQAEKGMSYELGTDVHLAANVRAGVTAFLIDMQDEISWDFVAQRNENLDKTRHGGVETYAAVTPVDILELGVNYTWTTAEFTGGANDGMDVPLVPEHKVSGSARFHLPQGVSVDGIVTYVGGQYLGTDLMNAGPMLDDYVTVDLFAHYRPTVVKGLDLFAGVENLFDEHYASLGYKGWLEDAYYPSPAQTLRAGASYKF